MITETGPGHVPDVRTRRTAWTIPMSGRGAEAGMPVRRR
jgi:hypothetical protein